MCLVTRITHLRNLLRREPWWAEVWSAAAALGWAAWLVSQPQDLMGRAPYQIIATMATDQDWMWVGFGVGAAQLLVVGLDHNKFRFGMAFVAAVFWGCLSYGLWLDNASFPGVVLYLVQAFANMTSMALLTIRPIR